MSNIAFLFLLLAFSSLPAVLPFVSPSSQVFKGEFLVTDLGWWCGAPSPQSVLNGSPFHRMFEESTRRTQVDGVLQEVTVRGPV